jgi:hypothetical protein
MCVISTLPAAISSCPLIKHSASVALQHRQGFVPRFVHSTQKSMSHS